MDAWSSDPSHEPVVVDEERARSAAVRRAARADVEVALAMDTRAVQTLHLTDRRLATAMAEFDANVDGRFGEPAESIEFNDVAAATHARLLAASSQARSRVALSRALDDFAEVWGIEIDRDGSSEPAPRVETLCAQPLPAHTSPAEAVVAEAYSIAVAADAEVVRELQAASARAAVVAGAAVRAAAVVVAGAADAARIEQRTLIADAASYAAAQATSTADQVRARADDLAVAMVARRELRPDAHIGGPLARESAATAAALAVETVCAAELVTEMGAAMAAALSSSASTLADLTALHVARAAEAVQAVAVAAAAEIATITLEAARLSRERARELRRSLSTG